MKLFAVMLGGRAPRANTELHDVVFVAGARIEDTYEQLLGRWFGTKTRLHIDSWWELDVVDGHRVTLVDKKADAASAEVDAATLYFVNMGGYRPGSFSELHEVGFLVASSPAEAKKRAKSELLTGAEELHVDDLHEVDDCLEIETVDDFRVLLTPTGQGSTTTPRNGYLPLPREVIAAYEARARAGGR